MGCRWLWFAWGRVRKGDGYRATGLVAVDRAVVAGVEVRCLIVTEPGLVDIVVGDVGSTWEEK